MSNYTTQTAALKAVTIDTAKIDAKRIDTKKLFINGELFDPSQIKESPNDAKFYFAVYPDLEDNYEEVAGGWQIESNKSILVEDDPHDQWWESLVCDGGDLINGSQTEGILPNGIYVYKEIDDNFVKCIGGNTLNDTDGLCVNNIPFAKFEFMNINSLRLEQCILENFLTVDPENERLYWVIKICEEDDNLSELYGGITEDMPFFDFVISIPYYIPEYDYTSSSSTYSLRKTNLFDSLREKFEQMRQRFEERKQQNLDNPTE